MEFYGIRFQMDYWLILRRNKTVNINENCFSLHRNFRLQLPWRPLLSVWRNERKPLSGVNILFIKHCDLSLHFQIGFSNSSPLLSSKLQYPLYFRTNPSEEFSNLGRIAILKRFKWKRVAILQRNNDVFTGISNSLADLLKQENINVAAYESYKDHPEIALDNLKVSFFVLWCEFHSEVNLQVHFIRVIGFCLLSQSTSRNHN